MRGGGCDAEFISRAFCRVCAPPFFNPVFVGLIIRRSSQQGSFKRLRQFNQGISMWWDTSRSLGLEGSSAS